MSRSIMVEEEFPGLIAAQAYAAGCKSYRQWNDWMRGAFSYSVAKRMAAALGYEQPCEAWYDDMRLIGERIMKECYATERVNYTFRADAESIGDEGGQETGAYHQAC